MIGGAPARFLGALLACVGGGLILLAITYGFVWIIAESLKLLYSLYLWIGVAFGWVTL